MNDLKDEKIEPLLADYDGLTDRLGELLKREQACLKAGGSLEGTLEEKKMLLEEISALNARLSAYSRDRDPMDVIVKTRVEGLQNKLMSILKLDRAVEKQYLSLSARAARPSDFVPAPARVSQAYGRQACNEAPRCPDEM